MTKNEIAIRELMDFTNMTFHEINQNIKNFQLQKVKYNDLLTKHNDLEAKMKQSELHHRNELEDLRASISEQIEEKTDEFTAAHQLEIKALKSEILKSKLEFEDANQKKIYQMAELEKKIVELESTLTNLSRQDEIIKHLEHTVESKNLMIKNSERDLSKMKQRMDDLMQQNSKLKTALNNSDHTKL